MTIQKLLQKMWFQHQTILRLIIKKSQKHFSNACDIINNLRYSSIVRSKSMFKLTTDDFSECENYLVKKIIINTIKRK